MNCLLTCSDEALIANTLVIKDGMHSELNGGYFEACSPAIGVKPLIIKPLHTQAGSWGNAKVFLSRDLICNVYYRNGAPVKFSMCRYRHLNHFAFKWCHPRWRVKQKGADESDREERAVRGISGKG